MSIDPTTATCSPDTGCVVPYEFVRLRYYFGQRLGVLELTDEQAYVVGKLRFHHQRLHGAGVLCGLLAERYAPSGTPTTTLLRVSSGAAIDGCGREIVAGWDSCIDVAAWYAKNRATNADLADPTAASAQRVWVAICYRECPSDPAPAPRDPCGCDATGCEHSRVREGFALELRTDSLLPAPPATTTPGGPCPAAPTDGCLVLARVDLVVDAAGVVTDIAEPDNQAPERVALWTTAALQAALAGVVDTGDLASALGGGPRLGALGFEAGAGPTDGTVTLPVLLADGADGEPSPLLGDAVAGVTFSVRAHADDGSWAAAPIAATVTYDATEGRYELLFGGSLAPGRYRLRATVSDDTPVVDAAFRELRPRTLSRWFRLELDGGVLVLSTTLSS